MSVTCQGLTTNWVTQSIAFPRFASPSSASRLSTGPFQAPSRPLPGPSRLHLIVPSQDEAQCQHHLIRTRDLGSLRKSAEAAGVPIMDDSVIYISWLCINNGKSAMDIIPWFWIISYCTDQVTGGFISWDTHGYTVS